MWGDTIVALATPWGEGGIAVLRLSGPEALSVAGRVLRPFDRWQPRRAFLADLIEPDGQSIDRPLVLVFPSPNSYTGEDLVEIHVHGGRFLALRAVELVINAGARNAQPGEFTRRAFENGRMDLSQAEAVAALIGARSVEALHSAQRALKGQLGEELGALAQEVLQLASLVEAGLDFPEEDVPYLADEDLQGSLATLRLELADLRDRCTSGLVLREGVKVALLGRPNAGKSSLLNCLLNEERSIVTSIPGTTRDTVEGVFTYQGVPLRLVDTAGLGEEPHDQVEELGMLRSKKAGQQADLCLWLIDRSRPLDMTDRELITQLLEQEHALVLTKSDLPAAFTVEQLNHLFPDSEVVEVSSSTKAGIDALKDTVLSKIYGHRTLSCGLNASSHQIELLKQADENLAQAQLALNDGLGQGTAASCLAEVRNCFDRLLGIGSDQQLLHQIFSQFCIGK